MGGKSGASDRRNSCPDRVAAGGRLPRCGTVGILDGSSFCGDDGVPRCAAGSGRYGKPPPVRCKPCVEQLAVRPRIRGRLQSMRGLCESLNLTAMNLTMTQPAIRREKILLIEGIHDLLCSKDDIEDLWQSWGKPDIWRLPYGHVRICCGGVPGLPGRVLSWLALRFDKSPSRNQMPPPNIGCSALT